MFHYSYFMSWDIDLLDTPLWIAKVFLLLHCSNQIRKRNQSKVSGPELNHDYISYSDIEIQYRWNRGSGPFLSLDHARIRRPIESACSWMLHRNPSLFLSFLHRERFIPSHKRNLSFFVEWNFLFVMVMQCKRSEIRLFLMMKRAFMLCEIYETRYLKVGNVRRRLSVSDGQIPTVGISLKAQTERINGLLEGYLRHFSANQKDWSCWMLLSAAIT